MVDGVRKQEYPDGTIGKLVQEFPYKYDENGKCEMLVDNKCTAYEDRPLICRVDDLGNKLGLNQSEWYQENISSCHEMMEEDGIIDQYRIIWQEEEK
jgi:Fe-S-cluster containining protein